MRGIVAARQLSARLDAGCIVVLDEEANSDGNTNADAASSDQRYQRLLLYERFDLGQHVIAADERHDLAPNGVSGSVMRCRA